VLLSRMTSQRTRFALVRGGAEDLRKTEASYTPIKWVWPPAESSPIPPMDVPPPALQMFNQLGRRPSKYTHSGSDARKRAYDVHLKRRITAAPLERKNNPASLDAALDYFAAVVIGLGRFGRLPGHGR
jgi:hypothetical protein